MDESLKIIETACDHYGINIAIAFNGGKDSIVLLHLVHQVFKKKYSDELTAIYFDLENTFPEIVDICHETAKEYNLNIIIKNNFKVGLSELKESHPHIKAIFVGTRYGDPYSSHLQAFNLTDSDWPEFMRISPILSWDYTDIWKYILHHQLKYCTLYDQGYTSIGQINNTIPNPILRTDNGYLPAYCLFDGSKERDGRIKS